MNANQLRNVASNVMIHENGSIQIIDFGVSAVLQSKVDKRRTVIGTGHFMAPEMLKAMWSQKSADTIKYGTEVSPDLQLSMGNIMRLYLMTDTIKVDIWAFGCSLIEFATGLPPNSNIDPRSRMLSVTVGRNAPALAGDEYSEELRNLVSFVVAGKPGDRPTIAEILEHPYLRETETTHPTKSLAELVKNYYLWEYSGGQRQSLLFAGGAAASEYSHSLQDLDEWNFSTTLGFEQQVAQEDQSDFIAPNETDPSLSIPTVSQQKGAFRDTATASDRAGDFQGESTRADPVTISKATLTSSEPAELLRPTVYQPSIHQRVPSGSYYANISPATATSSHYSDNLQATPTSPAPVSSSNRFSTFIPQDLTLSGPSTPHYPVSTTSESPTSHLDRYSFSSSSNTPLYSLGLENEMSDNISPQDQARLMASAMRAENIREESASHRQLNEETTLQKLLQEEQLRKETRVKRGQKALEGLFDEEKAQYKYEAKKDFDKEVARELARLREQGHKPRSESEHPSYFGTDQSNALHEFQYSLDDFDPDPHDDMTDEIASETPYKTTEDVERRAGHSLPQVSGVGEFSTRQQFNYSLDDFQLDPPGDEEHDLSQDMLRTTQRSGMHEYGRDLPLHSTSHESTTRQQFEYSLDDFQIDPHDDEVYSFESSPRAQRAVVPRSGSDLPLRDTSNESAVLHQIEYPLAHRSDPQDAPSIDLANVNTIKATKKQSRRVAKDDAILYDNAAEFSKRATPSSDDAAGQAAKSSSKRETMEWSFSAAMGESSNSAATLPRLPMVAESATSADYPARPQLKHSTTAPVGRVFASSEVLDLDAMLAGHPSDSYATAARPTFDDEQTTFPEVGAPFEATSPKGTAIDRPAKPQAQANPSGTTISSEDDHLDADDEGVYDPFQFVSNDEDKVKEEIDAFLATTGVVDPVMMADLRQQMLESRMAATGPRSSLSQ